MWVQGWGPKKGSRTRGPLVKFGILGLGLTLGGGLSRMRVSNTLIITDGLAREKGGGSAG